MFWLKLKTKSLNSYPKKASNIILAKIEKVNFSLFFLLRALN